MDLGSIQDVFTHEGPFISVHIDVSRDTEDARQQIDARWTTLRHELEHHGVDRELIEQIGERVHEQTSLPGEVHRTVVAGRGRVVFDDVRAGHSIWPERTSFGALPDLGGWLHQVDGQVPFLLVRADREGASVDFYRGTTRPQGEHREVHGETLHIKKVPEGDWAQKQYQQRSENVWKENAEEVAAVIREATAAHRPRVAVLAGDPRARTDIVTALEGHPLEIVQVEAGGRAAGSSEEALWAEVEKVLGTIEATDEKEIVDRLMQETGRQEGPGVRGLGEVLDALVRGQVERLVLDLEAAHEMTVSPKEHPGLSLPEPAASSDGLPADQVLVAAGAATDAQLSLMPRAQTKGAGVAALLRWAE
jgi:hypothetical protein